MTEVAEVKSELARPRSQTANVLEDDMQALEASRAAWRDHAGWVEDRARDLGVKLELALGQRDAAQQASTAIFEKAKALDAEVANLREQLATEERVHEAAAVEFERARSRLVEERSASEKKLAATRRELALASDGIAAVSVTFQKIARLRLRPCAPECACAPCLAEGALAALRSRAAAKGESS